jgi:hypothetical protein
LPRASIVWFPAHALLILEERLSKQMRQGARGLAGLDRTELAPRIPVTVAVLKRSSDQGSQGWPESEVT